MTLTRKERESLVIDLLNKCTPIREIAKQAGLSFRDIGAIKKKAEEEREAREGQAQQIFASTQAYKLFSEGKSPVQVSIALNLREPEVARFYVEYWKLRQLYSLNKIYEEIKDDIGPFVNLYILAKVARMDTPSVIRVLEIANNDLPLVEHKCERLKREVYDLEANKHNSARLLQEISDQITYLRKICKEQRLELTKIQLQKVRLEGLVDNFQNNKGELLKIRNTVKEKVYSVLSDAKPLLTIALLSLVESIRKDPDRYSSLIYHNTSPPVDYISQYYSAASYGQQQYPSQDYKDMLVEEAEKLYNKLARKLVDGIITEYTFNITSSLPVLQPANEEQQSHRRQTTAANQSYTHKEEHKFIRSEIDNEDQDS